MRNYWGAWTEDGFGLLFGFFMFIIGLVCAVAGKDIENHYAKTPEWPLGEVIVWRGTYYMLLTKQDVIINRFDSNNHRGCC